MHPRHIFIICFLIIFGEFFISCSSESPDDTHGSELQFTTADPSRSSISTSLNYEGSEFTVYGDMKFGGDASPAQNVIIFDGVPVTFAASSWIYDQPQYWYPNHEHSFVAVHPARPAGASDFAYQNHTLSFSYSHPEKFDDAQDLMVATHRRLYSVESSSTTAPVTLRFNHITSRINFNVENDRAAETVKITRIELKGVNKSGSFSITPASLLSGSLLTDDYTFSWSGITDKVTLAADIDVDIPMTETRFLFPDDNALFILPQPDNKEVGLTIDYTLLLKSGKTENKTMEATTPIGGWNPGKVYTYNISITPNIQTIEFTLSVTDWKDGTNDDVLVPRK